MKRSAPLKRTKSLRRTTGEARTSAKVRKCPVKKGGCGSSFVPDREKQIACLECAGSVGAWLNKEKAKKDAIAKAKEDRQQLQARKDAIKKISDLEADCRKIVQKMARIRDRRDGCISCHMGPNYGGQWHGSHYRAHGGCSSLQFHLWNIHKACAQCNLFKSGNKEGFILGLLKKPGYGRERIDWLDCQPKSKRFSREYLLRFKAVMGKRLRRMEKWS